MTQVDGHTLARDVRAPGQRLLASTANGKLDITLQCVRLKGLNELRDFFLRTWQKYDSGLYIALQQREIRIVQLLERFGALDGDLFAGEDVFQRINHHRRRHISERMCVYVPE